MTTTANETAWSRVADALEERMAELGLDQIDLARQAGVSDATIRKLQKASSTRYHRSTLNKVARALGWPADAFWTLIATGEKPEPLETPTHRSNDGELLDDLAELRLRLSDLEAKLRRRESA